MTLFVLIENTPITRTTQQHTCTPSNLNVLIWKASPKSASMSSREKDCYRHNDKGRQDRETVPVVWCLLSFFLRCVVLLLIRSRYRCVYFRPARDWVCGRKELISMPSKLLYIQQQNIANVHQSDKQSSKTGPAMLHTSSSIWFIPAIRPSRSAGANRGIEACIAGMWKLIKQNAKPTVHRYARFRPDSGRKSTARGVYKMQWKNRL